MIIDKVIAACNVCSNSWFLRKDDKNKLILPKKCPACSSPNWNKKNIRKYIRKPTPYFPKRFGE